MPGQHQGAVSDKSSVLLIGIELSTLPPEARFLSVIIVSCHQSRQLRCVTGVQVKACTTSAD
jgi:hypothetical protein